MFVRAASPDVAAIAQWSATDYLIADLFDLTANANFKRPKAYPRPAEAAVRRQNDDARAQALLAQQRQRNGGD